jgi:hypothetical protein
VEVVAAAFQAGVVFRDFIAATINHPEDVLKNLLAAAKAYGTTLKEMVSAAVEQAIDDMKKCTIEALLELGYAAVEVFDAAAEIAGGALAVVFTLILQWTGSYRPLRADEKADAEKVFGKSIDLDEVQIAAMHIPVELIQKANGHRPFTTMYLLNFESEAQVTRDVLIHELVHVWQGLVSGPLYMIEALHAQLLGEGYDYGGVTGLESGGGDFSKFNREQQGKIIEDYFRLRYLDEEAEDVYGPYLPYAQAVFTTA